MALWPKTKPTDHRSFLPVLGAKVVIVGIQPEIAFSMVQLGLTLEGSMTSLDLEEGLIMLWNADRENRKTGHGS